MAPDPFITIWEFYVPTEREDQFLATYGPAGSWASLFAKADGYRGTELIRDRDQPSRFLTLDYWLTPEAYRAFRDRFKDEYQALDHQSEALTTEERHLGGFRLAGSPRSAF